jgi:DNA-binding LytR/AlgR family response regulator
MVRRLIPSNWGLANWGPYDDARGWLRGLLISVAGAMFLGFGGAFGSGSVAIPARLIYWLVLMVLGWLWGSFVSRYFFRRAETMNLWLRTLLAAVAMAVPFSAVVALAGVVAFHNRYDLADIPGLVGSVTLISVVTIAINILVDRQAAATSATGSPPKFLERLPLKLRGAEVWAVEAEDHYLRLHTSKGQDLILMRLADAISELEGIEGAQAHRSWWVARDAITGAERGDGRATLTLKDGSEVPVSRTFARVLRAKGWF